MWRVAERRELSGNPFAFLGARRVPGRALDCDNARNQMDRFNIRERIRQRIGHSGADCGLPRVTSEGLDPDPTGRQPDIPAAATKAAHGSLAPRDIRQAVRLGNQVPTIET